jgi:hypothetical protein
VASLRGLEPPTSWFVAMRSIQLSYRLAFYGGSQPEQFDDLLTSQTLYPAELRARCISFITSSLPSLFLTFNFEVQSTRPN